MRRKFTDPLSVSCGNGVGPSPDVPGAGGAASVGNKELISTVAVGCAGGTSVGEGVVVGKNGSSVGTLI